MRAAAGPRVAVVDYGMGNRRSVEKALERVGAHTELTADPHRLSEADALVVPGVGSFPRGMENLRSRGLDELICERAAAGIPILGICLGMQLLFDHSVEVRSAAGLGLVAGEVTPLHAEGQRLPHIGWNLVRSERPSPIGGEPGTERAYYHVHSYVARPADPEDVVGTCEYGERFASIIARGAVYGVQFHPEKSSRDGLALLERFVALATRAPAGVSSTAPA